MLDTKRAIKHTIVFPTVYSGENDITGNAAKDQKDLPMTDTSNFTGGDRVIIGRGTDREEEGIIDSVDTNVKLVLVGNLTYNHTIDANTTVDTESAADQKVLSVTATTNFVVGETVVVDLGESHEATYTIASIQAGTSLTMVENLEHTHAIGEAVAQTGVGETVEVCMASISAVIPKGGYQNVGIVLPSTWVTAAITFLGSDEHDGTFYQVVHADDVSEVTVASVAASKFITLNGEIRDAMAALPYLKIRSGTAASAVDQGTGNPEITVILTR